MPDRKIAAIVLAAGRSTRMGSSAKQLATVGGKALVRIAAETALASRASPVCVVIGHEGERVRSALAGLPIKIVENPNFAEGLSTSLHAGLTALPADTGGAVVLLADMPEITPAMIDRLLDAFDPGAGNLIIVPTLAGKRGNPVLWSATFFRDLMAVRGDAGGRQLLEANAGAVVEVELGPAAGRDVDTPEDLAAIGGRPGDDR